MTGSKAGSKPENRVRIFEGLKALPVGSVLRAESLEELKKMFDMEHVSNTQFSKALRSLCYHYRAVRINRPHAWGRHFGPRVFEVSYIPTLDPAIIPEVAVV